LFQGRNNLQIDKKSFIEIHSKSLVFSVGKCFSEKRINQLAKRTGFIRRSRKLPASSFVNTLMFSACNQAATSLPDITADLHQQFSIDISKEGLHKKFSDEGVKFLQELVRLQLSQQFSPAGAELKKHFAHINIKDSSKFSLPSIYNKDYPGFGNFSKKNGLMNLQYEYDLVSGNWLCIELTTGHRNDQLDSRQTIGSIAKGDLYIRDLGYVTPTYLKAIIDKGAYFLNRMPPQVTIHTVGKRSLNWRAIHRTFSKTGTHTLDLDVLIYQREMLPCRLVIERATNEEYRKRLRHAEHSAKKHGVGLSQEHQLRCRYNAFITNVDREILPIDKIRKTYYLRWQIELVFKTWKSFFEINKVKKVKKERMECQLLAKLLWVLLNWQLFQSCNRCVQASSPEKGVSLLKFFKRCIRFSDSLRLVVLNRTSFMEWLTNVFLPLIENTLCEAPTGKLTHYQILNSFLSLS
jgi:Transposase DDE domain